MFLCNYSYNHSLFYGLSILSLPLYSPIFNSPLNLHDILNSFLLSPFLLLFPLKYTTFHPLLSLILLIYGLLFLSSKCSDHILHKITNIFIFHYSSLKYYKNMFSKFIFLIFIFFVVICQQTCLNPNQIEILLFLKIFFLLHCFY